MKYIIFPSTNQISSYYFDKILMYSHQKKTTLHMKVTKYQAAVLVDFSYMSTCGSANVNYYRILNIITPIDLNQCNCDQ